MVDPAPVLDDDPTIESADDGAVHAFYVWLARRGPVDLTDVTQLRHVVAQFDRGDP